MKKLFTLFVFISAMMVSTQSFAGCCINPIPAINKVKAAVDATRLSITTAVIENGKAVTQQLVANNESRNKAIKDQTKTIEEIMKAHAITLGSMEAQRLYGSGGEVEVNGKKVRLTAQSPSLCDQLKAARALMESELDRVNAQAIVSENERSHNEDFRSINESSDRLRNSTREDFDMQWTNKMILTEEEVAKAVESIKNLTNPVPLPKLEDEYKNTPQGRTYLAHRALINQKHTLAQSALTKQLLARAPLVDDGEEKSSVMGKMQERIYETVEDADADPWIEALERKGLAPLLRELNVTAAHIYKVNFEIYKTNQDVVALLTVLASADTRERGLAAYREYSRTMGVDDDKQ